MSNNLYKCRYTNLQQEEKRVIDANGMMEKRMEKLHARMQQKQEEQGFVSGLNAPGVDVEALLQDTENAGSNIIKAGEDEETIRSSAKAEAEEMLEKARAEAQQILGDAKASALAEREKVLSDARQQGYTEGLLKTQKEEERLQKEFKKKEKQLEEEYQQYMNELEPRFVDTITGIYEHIFHVELESYRDILVYLISATMRKIEGNRNFMVHVSKDDYPYVSMQKKQIVAGAASANCSIEIVEDMTLAKNECLIETEGGIFDCGLGTQLEELGQKLRILSYEREKDNR